MRGKLVKKHKECKLITRLDKEKQIQSLSESIKKAKASFLVHFQGLSVQQITDLRKNLKTKGQADMYVCRNTLINRALSENKEIQKHFHSHLTGSSAFVCAFDNPSATVKVLSNFVKETELLQIKTGMLEQKGLSPQDIKVLADLPSMEVLRGQFLSVLSATMSKCLSLFSAVPGGVLRAFSAYQKQKKD